MSERGEDRLRSRADGATFREQDCSSVTRDAILQISAACQPVGQIHRAPVSTVKVAMRPAVEPGNDRR